MKLYLSSYHLSNDPEKLAKLFRDGDKISIIPNALDFSTDNTRLADSLNCEFDDLRRIGVEPELLDLKNYFH